jgi:hypothetical protein
VGWIEKSPPYAQVFATIEEYLLAVEHDIKSSPGQKKLRVKAWNGLDLPR